MHSFLIIGTDETSLENEAQKLSNQFQIHTFDKTIVRKEKSIGIEDIRNLQKELLLIPLKSPYKAGIVYAADTMTIDAQNAFLKTLEEPPQHTIIILLAGQKEHFLPTVLSRCSIQHIKSPSLPKTNADNLLVLETIGSMSLGTKLKHAELLSKTKDNAISWLENGLAVLRKELYISQQVTSTQKIRKLQHAHVLLKKTNANTRVVLEHLLLSL